MFLGVPTKKPPNMEVGVLNMHLMYISRGYIVFPSSILNIIIQVKFGFVK